MPQNTILAVSASGGRSSAVPLAAGAKGRIGLYAGLVAPTNAAFSQTDTGGSLPPSTTYHYRVTATNAQGESLASVSTSGSTSATAGSTHAMVVNWTAVAGATGYRVYGRSSGSEQLIAAVGDATTYTDTGAIAPSGAVPSKNTTASGLPAGSQASVFEITPAADLLVGELTAARPVMPLEGLGTFVVELPPGRLVGVWSIT
jgi:hypothetical protein